MSKLIAAREIVAFDVIERDEDKKGVVSFERKGDKQIFEAVDSCVQAAQAWWRRDNLTTQDAFAVLNVPICLLSMPFWDVCIDEGRVGTPEILRRGYHTIGYPSELHAQREIMTVVWAAEELDDLLHALNHLFDWFRAEIMRRAKESRPFSLTTP
jgi:hypothetical protein